MYYFYYFGCYIKMNNKSLNIRIQRNFMNYRYILFNVNIVI